jgi:uncharacterized protein (DUF58 family)
MVVYPSRRAIVLLLAGAPAALLVAAAAPKLWVLAAGWVLLGLALTAADAMLAAPAEALRVAVAAPDLVGVGREATLRVDARFEGAAPRNLEIAVALDDRLSLADARSRRGVRTGGASPASARRAGRRGVARLLGVWTRWRGPLGLVWRQRIDRPDLAVRVTPEIESLLEEGLRLFARDAPLGAKAQREVGEGREFHALKEFQTGMDLRAIDWKQSARHGRLVGREYRTERNHNIVLALDAGRLMSAPISGEARIDRAVSAALMLAFVGLKLGDRVGLFSFDARPRLASGAVSEVDYSTDETNFTLGLTSLAGRLDRRSLVVVFTDFADPTSAALMVEHVGRLARTHLVLLVTFRDEDLERLSAAEPREPDDVSRAVVAGALLRQRQMVMTQLRRLGVQILEAPAAQIGPTLINRYLDVKRRELV